MRRSDVVTAWGAGPPVILLPGIQGRWEWMEPAVRALSRHHRVLTFSLNRLAIASFFDAAVHAIDEMLETDGLKAATVVGVSFGGLLAACYAGRRPDRVSSLVLVSAPAPDWPLDPGTRRYLHRPRLAAPAFAVRAAVRMFPEVVAALPDWRTRAQFGASHLARIVRAPLSPTRMAAWVQAWMAADLGEDVRRVTAPTLLVTGEPSLDRVVPVASTLEYLHLIRGARHHVLERTGHVGLLLRPEEFARVVRAFSSDAFERSRFDPHLTRPEHVCH